MDGSSVFLINPLQVTGVFVQNRYMLRQMKKTGSSQNICRDEPVVMVSL
jgi:hypothetical protein